MNIKFSPEIKTLGFFEPDKVFETREIRDETMFFSCSPDFIFKNKYRAPISSRIIGKIIDLESVQGNIVIDTRVNMLMPGQYPSIPGWHCDDVPRKGQYSQPDFNLCSDNVQHYMILLSDSRNPAECVSGTEFVTNERNYDINRDKVWQSLHENVEVDSDKRTRFVKEREIIKFNQLAIHRASPAKNNGWRLFIRLSATHRKVINEIRNQVQVYVDPNNAGW